MVDTKKLFNSKKYDVKTNRSTFESPMVDLVTSVNEAAANNNMTLSRWESNGSGRSKTVTYALHTGERAAQFRYMDNDAIVDHFMSHKAEGTTPRCEAYKELEKMAQSAGLI